MLKVTPSAEMPVRLYADERSTGTTSASGAKYPLISTIRSVVLDAKTSTEPFITTGTIAALATTFPANEFSVETPGCGCPAGHVVR